jgi:hypothetical protein
MRVANGFSTITYDLSVFMQVDDCQFMKVIGKLHWLLKLFDEAFIEIKMSKKNQYTLSLMRH